MAYATAYINPMLMTRIKQEKKFTMGMYTYWWSEKNKRAFRRKGAGDVDRLLLRGERLTLEEVDYKSVGQLIKALCDEKCVPQFEIVKALDITTYNFDCGFSNPRKRLKKEDALIIADVLGVNVEVFKEWIKE